MKAGVSIDPWASVRRPRRAAPSQTSTVKSQSALTALAYNDSRALVRWRASRTITPAVKRLRVGIVYGGRSGEHEVSLASAAAVFANLDRQRYEPVPIRIEKDGRWALADRPPTAVWAAEVIEQARLEAARPIRSGREV